MDYKTASDLLRIANDYNAAYNMVLGSNNAARAAYQEKARDALYKNLALGYELANSMLDPAHAEAVTDFFKVRGVTMASKANPFYACVKALYGKDKDPIKVKKTKSGPKVQGVQAMIDGWQATGTISTWVPNRSAGKYANVFRLAKQRGISPAMFAHWLHTFKDDDFGGGLTGAERRDRKANGNNDPVADAALKSDVDLVVSQPPVAVVDLSRVVIEDVKARFICVWGTLDDTEQFNVMGELPNMAGAIERYLERTAREKVKVLRAALALVEAAKNAPKTPAKRKNIKVGGKVSIEKQEAAHVE